MPWSTWKPLVHNKEWVVCFFLAVDAHLLLISLKVCDWSGHIFGASPVLVPHHDSGYLTVHVGEHDTKYVTFELLMHAAFVADEVGVLCLNQLVPPASAPD